jgi:hypothetical protein
VSELKELFLNPELRTGGFYELAIQVCPSANNLPIKNYTNYIWEQNYIEGPFDENFNLISVKIENNQHRGVITFGDYKIPFMTYNIREDEPIETGYNWFDICFYTAAIEHVFGEEYQTWINPPKVPIELNIFLKKIAVELYKIFPFQLALKDFEVSGEYYLKDLEENLVLPYRPQFMIGKDNIENIKESNKPFMIIMEDLE